MLPAAPLAFPLRRWPFFFLLFPPNRQVRMADYITEGGQRTKYTGFDEGFIINISAAAGKKKEAKQNTDRLLLLMAGQKKRNQIKKRHTPFAGGE